LFDGFERITALHCAPFPKDLRAACLNKTSCSRRIKNCEIIWQLEQKFQNARLFILARTNFQTTHPRFRNPRRLPPLLPLSPKQERGYSERACSNHPLQLAPAAALRPAPIPLSRGRTFRLGYHEL